MPMIPFKTANTQLIRLAHIIIEMKCEGYDEDIIADAFRFASIDQGMYDLMELWRANWDSPNDRELIMQDILSCIRDYRLNG